MDTRAKAAALPTPTINPRYMIMLLLLAVAFALPFSALANATSDTSPSINVSNNNGNPVIKRDINTNLIDHIVILNNQNMLFYMANNEVYLNELPRQCPTLDKNSTIKYETNLPLLTNLDNFQVVYPTGNQLMPGPSCQFGKFTQVSKAQAKTLIQQQS